MIEIRRTDSGPFQKIFMGGPSIKKSSKAKKMARWKNDSDGQRKLPLHSQHTEDDEKKLKDLKERQVEIRNMAYRRDIDNMKKEFVAVYREMTIAERGVTKQILCEIDDEEVKNHAGV